MSRNVQPILWQGGELLLLDQRRLPHEEKWVTCRSASDVSDAIRTMVVRGAPAIGVSAAFGLALEAAAGEPSIENLENAAELLLASRPTAVNLQWAVERMLVCARRGDGDLGSCLRNEAEAIFAEDLSANRKMGELGSSLLPDRATILTHCNAGALATSGFGTALGVVRAAVESGKQIDVFAGETRPFLQGARLTAWELMEEGIEVTLITDNMAGYFFRRGTFDAVIVGADRIAANGDTANKIGTYTLAVLAAANDVPFYVAAPASTIDPRTPNGDSIPIEERSAEEVAEVVGLTARGEIERVRIAPAGVRAAHPAFDITPAELISAIITERGILRRPYTSAIADLFKGDGS